MSAFLSACPFPAPAYPSHPRLSQATWRSWPYYSPSVALVAHPTPFRLKIPPELLLPITQTHLRAQTLLPGIPPAPTRRPTDSMLNTITYPQARLQSRPQPNAGFKPTPPPPPPFHHPPPLPANSPRGKAAAPADAPNHPAPAGTSRGPAPPSAPDQRHRPLTVRDPAAMPHARRPPAAKKPRSGLESAAGQTRRARLAPRPSELDLAAGDDADDPQHREGSPAPPNTRGYL
jgi:hypothetical protein